VEPKPTDAEVEALLAAAKATRKRPSRGLWIAALVLSVASVIGLGYGLVTNWDEPADTAVTKSPPRAGSGFTLGLMIGLGVGVAIGSLLALRKRTESDGR
jgi:hypothetical protein